MRDGATGRSRGFGFLTFKDPKTVNTVMVKEHFLDGKIVRPTLFADSKQEQLSLGSREMLVSKRPRYFHGRRSHRYLPQNRYLQFDQIDPKRAIPKDEQEKTAKIFVGGVSQDATEDQFTGFFAQFGRVIDATLMMDKDTGRPRGFGFVTFDSDTAVERVLQYQPLEILGKPIEVKRAQPRGKLGEEEDFLKGGGRGRGGGRFNREDRFNEGPANQNQAQAPNQMAMNGMSPQMMAQYWQRMQQYFQMMQQQMMVGAMGGMNQMNPQMMMQMQQMQQMQGGKSPNPQNMNPQQMQQMMQMMNMQNQQGNMGNAGGQRPSSGGQGGQQGGSQGSNGRGFSAQEQNMSEQQKYEQQARKAGTPSGPKGQGGGPQSWEGMYDDVPQPDGQQGGPRRNGTPLGGKPPKGPTPTPQPSNAPVGAPTGPKNAGKPGANFRGGRGGGGRYHPYGR